MAAMLRKAKNVKVNLWR